MKYQIKYYEQELEVSNDLTERVFYLHEKLIICDVFQAN